MRKVTCLHLFLAGAVLAASPGGARAQDVGELVGLIEAWGACPRGSAFDRNNDGVVDGLDLALALNLGPGDGIPPGYKVIEGDIIVPEDFSYGGGPESATYATNLWSGGLVRYEFDSNVTQQSWKDMAQAAMADWEVVANVDFQHCANDDCGFILSHLHIQDASGNNSLVGDQDLMIEQPVNIASWNSEFIIAHELGHALGLWHEQSRSDRVNYVTINYNNVAQTCCDNGPCDFNFDFWTDMGPFGSGEYGPYDYDSVMHYGRCAFSICCVGCVACTCPAGCETITVQTGITIDMPNLVGCNTPATCQALLGQRTHLSYFDALFMSFLYPEADWRFVDADYSGTQNGTTFFEPYEQFGAGYANTPESGVLWVQPGTYLAIGTYDKAITINGPIGGVTLGN